MSATRLLAAWNSQGAASVSEKFIIHLCAVVNHASLVLSVRLWRCMIAMQPMHYRVGACVLTMHASTGLMPHGQWMVSECSKQAEQLSCQVMHCIETVMK